MKRISIVILVCVAMCSSLLSCDCQSKSSNTPEIYNVMVNYDSKRDLNIDATNYDTFSLLDSNYINIEAADSKEETVFGKIYDLNYEHSVRSWVYGEEVDCFYDRIANVEMEYTTNGGKLHSIRSRNSSDGIIAYSHQNITDADDYLAWMGETIVPEVFNIDVSEYNLICTTYMKDHYSKEHQLIVAPDEINQISFYYLEYARYCGKYKTADLIKIISNPDGSIIGMTYMESGIDDFESISIDESKLDLTIDNTVRNICADDYELVDYKVDDGILQIIADKLVVLCKVELYTIDKSGNNINSAIILAVEL